MGLFNRFRAAPPANTPSPEPANDLERAVQAARAGLEPLEVFLSCLLRSQVFVLMKGDPSTDPAAPRQPLVLPSSKGVSSVCIFTSPERSTEVQRRHPEYRAGLLVDFSWVLRGMPPDLGLVLNPGTSLSLEQPAEGVARLKEDFLPGAPA